MKILFAFSILLVMVSNIIVDQRASSDAFQFFKNQYRRVYSNSQEIYRQQVFLHNKERIDQHNSKANKNYTMKINKFADLTQQQFREIYLGTRISSPLVRGKIEEPLILEGQVYIDWRKEGKVTRVKNQLMCGSCWAFASIGALQSAYMIDKGIKIELSQQQLVDCSTPFGNKGCQGGQLEYTFNYLKQKGVKTEDSYPYVGKDKNCKTSKGGPYKISSYNRDIACGGLYRSLLNGPVTVAVEALFWAFYKEGIYDDCKNEVNHAVLVVGVTKEYWLIKNSWGIDWGDQGYIKLARGNTCSVCEYPFSPLL